MELFTFRLGWQWIHLLLLLLLDISSVVKHTSARPKWPDPSIQFSVSNSVYSVANSFTENETTPGGNLIKLTG